MDREVGDRIATALERLAAAMERRAACDERVADEFEGTRVRCIIETDLAKARLVAARFDAERIGAEVFARMTDAETEVRLLRAMDDMNRLMGWESSPKKPDDAR